MQVQARELQCEKRSISICNKPSCIEREKEKKKIYGIHTSRIEETKKNPIYSVMEILHACANGMAAVYTRIKPVPKEQADLDLHGLSRRLVRKPRVLTVDCFPGQLCG